MLDLDIIESLCTSNCLPEFQLKVLESVLKNYFTTTKLWTLTHFNNHSEHSTTKGILDYQPTIKAPN